MDPRVKLQRVARGASECNINLDDHVDRVLLHSPSRGSRALVYSGTMHSSGRKVAIKVFRFGPPSEEKSVKVSFYFHSNFYDLCCKICSACPQRSRHVVHVTSQEYHSSIWYYYEVRLYHFVDN